MKETKEPLNAGQVFGFLSVILVIAFFVGMGLCELYHRFL